MAAGPGGVVHVVWYDERDAGYPEIFYKRSTDAGVNWSADTRLTNSDLIESEYPSVCVSSANVHLVWRDWRDGNGEIYYKRSTDAGVNWSTDTRLTNDANYSEYPSVCALGTNVHVVWYDSRAGGANYEIYYKRSTDNGVTWQTDARLSNGLKGSWDPSVATSGTNVHVVWRDDRDGPGSLDYGEIYYRCSTDGGTSWGSETRLTNNLNAESWYPSVAVTGAVVHVVWMDYRDGNSEIYYKCSTDGGTSWGPETRLTNDPNGSWQPSVYVSGTNVQVAWVDRRDVNWEVYYKRSTNSGASWGADTRLTNDPSDSWGASISVADPVVHVVWHDWRDGNTEIYYKRNPTGNLEADEKGNVRCPKSNVGLKIYQNPTNNKNLRIQYSIPKTGKVRLAICNALGQIKEILIDAEIKAGVYEKVLSKRVESGTYFINLSVDDKMVTRKIVVVE